MKRIIDYLEIAWIALCGISLHVGYWGNIGPLLGFGVGGGGTWLIIEAFKKVSE